MNKERSSNLHYGNFNVVAIVDGVVYTDKREDAPSWPEVYDELFECFPNAPAVQEPPMMAIPPQKPIVPSLRQVMRKRRILNETGSITKAAAGVIS